MSKQVKHFYEFGPFRLDPSERRLLRDRQTVPLTPKAFETLLVLVENSRHTVGKDELMNRVWPDAFVEETNLAQNISTLRKALGERPNGGQYIETVPKRGYRFVASVRKVRQERTDDAKSRAQTSPWTTSDLVEAGVPSPAAVSGGAAASGLAPGSRLGRYQILAPLGAGGMGEVYLAKDTQLDRRIALKLLPEQFTQDESRLRRFVREARAASALNHPNIITIYEIRELEGVHFIATEYIDGQTLRQLLRQGPLKLAFALEIAIQTANALAVAHEAGFAHRDIKPENIMVRRDGYIKVLDFGLAKLIEPATSFFAAPDAPTSASIYTDSGVVMGTVAYMSPEQARGLPVDARSDIFSLGVVLYEMIAGATPFSGPTMSDTLVTILDRAPAPLARYAPGVPAELERIVAKALRKDREERYQTVKDFQLDLKSLKQELEMAARSGHAPAVSAGAVAPAPAPSVPEPTPSRGVEIIHAPEVRYAKSGEVNIAYQVIGDAPLDLVFVMGWVSHLEYFWAEPSFARFLTRLASFARLILFDKRGTGLSDRVPLNQLPTLEQRMDDVRAVMEAVGSERAVLCGVSEGGPMCSLFAATYPEKTIALVMIGTYAKRIWDPDYPWAPTPEEQREFFAEIEHHWGGPVGIEARAPSVAHDPRFREWWSSYLRMGASPGAALALTRMNAEIDIRPVLPTVRVPTLILHRAGDRLLKVEEGRHMAEQIPGAKFIELPGIDHLPFVGDQDQILDEIEEFLTGMRHAPAYDQVLATVLVTHLDKGRGEDMLDRHREHTRREIELFKGRPIELTSERCLATFDGPARAIRAASAILDSARRMGIPVRGGLHTGECDVLEGRVGGMAVEIAAQVAATATPGAVWVSSTVKDLVAGSGLRFDDRGAHALPGVPGEWRLFAVERGGA